MTLQTGLLSVYVNQHQPKRVHGWLCPCPPSAGEKRLCLTSVRGICGKYQYSQENCISSEDAADPSGCCIGHGHKRGVCAQASGTFPWAGAAPAGSGVGSAGSAKPAWVPPPVPGEQQSLRLQGYLS